MSITAFSCPHCGTEVTEFLGPVGKPDEITPGEVRCPTCHYARLSEGREPHWIAHQHDRSKRFYCRLDHLYADAPTLTLVYGPNRITKQDFRNFEREGIFPPPIHCALPACGRRLYGGRRIVLTTGPGELFEPFGVWLEEVWVDGVERVRQRGFINANEVAEYLVEELRLQPDFARRKTDEMRPGRRIFIEPQP